MAPDLPIIGLTAHALAEERGRCLEAGMVDHVSKPINPDDLVAAALPYVNSRRVPQIPAPPLPALFEPLAATPQLPLSSAEAVIDWTALSERFQGRSAFIDKLLDMACQNNRKIPEKLREAARSADYETIAFHAHSLKGICGNIEATAAYEIARQTEDSARAGGNDAAYLAERLAEHLERVLVVLDARSQKPPL
jgi:HPt (histidine-containing phosphotransfer) domain-containing protein